MKRMIRVLALAAAFAVLLAAPGRSSSARTGLDVGMYCISLGHQRLECHFEISGGTGVYTLQWSPTPTRVAYDVGIAIVPCARAYSFQTVYLNVSDNAGNTGSVSDTHWCGDAE